MNGRICNKEEMELTNVLQTSLGKSLSSVILFGSRARGDGDEDSDWDLLVVANDLPSNPFRRRLLLKQRLPDEWRARVAFLIYTPDEFAHHVSSLLLGVAKDGVVLYDRNGLAARRLDYFRKELRHWGVVRERTCTGEVWRGMPSEVWNGSFAQVATAQ
jgi:predicted nucleotidyltransferase